MRHRSRSPERFRSRSPMRHRSRSPERFRSRSPERFRSRIPERFRSRSPSRNLEPPKIRENTIIFNSIDDQIPDIIQIALNDKGKMRETKYGFIVNQEKDGSVTAYKIDDGNGGEKDLDEEEKKLLLEWD